MLYLKGFFRRERGWPKMAKICMICEGAYPYVVGGVSSWVDDFIRSNREHQFILLCLIPNEEFAVRKYVLPENVT